MSEFNDDVPEVEEETVIQNFPEYYQPTTESYRNHPKIKQILKNPDVAEVRLRFKRNRQLYVCIIFQDGSSIERPLADIEDEEQPMCPTREPNGGMIINDNSGGSRGGGRNIERSRRSRWNFLRMKNKGNQTDIASIVENNDDITVKRVVTIVKKGCGCNGNHMASSGRRRNRRIPVQYEEVDYQE